MNKLTYNEIENLDAIFLVAFKNDDNDLIQLVVDKHEILTEMKRKLLNEVYIWFHIPDSTYYTLTFSKSLAS